MTSNNNGQQNDHVERWMSVGRELSRLARALTGNTHDAEDLVQQTIASILACEPEHLEHYGYARRALVNHWLDVKRREKSGWQRLKRLAATMSTAARHRNAHPPDAPDSKELRSMLNRAIRQLPPRQQAVLVLRLVEELSYDDIASLLECSNETVRANLHHARKKMRQLLEKEGATAP